MSLVRFSHVSLVLSGATLLSDVSFTVERGERVALIGLNGAGKSTLLKMMIGLHTPTSGQMEIRTKRIGYVPQTFETDRSVPVTVEEMLHAFTRATKKEIMEKLEDVQGMTLLKKRMGTLSGGERQRVLIACALLQNPELLLLDEATAGIDVVGEQNFYSVIARLQKQYGMAVVMVSHDIHHVSAHADKVLCIAQRILCQGTPKEVAHCDAFTTLYGAHLGHFVHHTHDHFHSHD